MSERLRLNAGGNMYCNSCGSPIGTDEGVCSRCGANIIGARAAVAARTRLAGNLQLVAILWFVYGVMFVIPMFIMMGMSGFLSAVLQQQPVVARIVSSGLFSLLALLFAAHAVASFIAGWGLYKVRSWGRTFALVIAFWSLLSPPLGTALGVYTLVVLLPVAAGDEYQRMSLQPGQSAAAKA